MKQNKSSKTYYLKDSYIKKIDKLAEKYSLNPSRLIEKAIDRVDEEGLLIPKIRSGKSGLKNTDS